MENYFKSGLKRSNKQQRYRFIADVLLIIAIITVVFTVFITGSNLNNGTVSGKYFWFYASMSLLSVFAIPAAIIKLKCRENINFRLPDLLILLFCASAVLITLNHTGRLTNKCLLLIFLMLFYFYLRIFLTGKRKPVYRLCCLAFIVTGLVEAVWGLMQLYGFTLSQHNLFKTTGSFFNSGPYSGWLAMVFPLVLWYAISAFTQKFPKINIKLYELSIGKTFIFLKIVLPGWIKTATVMLTVLCIVIVLPATMSRASWLAALGGCTFIGIMYGRQNKTVTGYFKKHGRKIVILSVSAVVLFAVSMAGLFMLKKDSASGRAFTWKIALQTIAEHPFGVGLGNFGGAYGNAQSAYFASGAGSEREEYVAGGVEYAFNEYLQICIETGIVPFLIFLAFAVCVLHLGIRNRNCLPAGSLVALLIFAAMSYPFNVLPFVIAFVFLSALCITDNRKCEDTKARKYPRFAVWTFITIVPAAIVLCTYKKAYPLYEAYKQWNRTQMLHSMDMHKEAAREYAEQYPYLQDEIKFLFEYAQSLSKSEQYDKSNEVLRIAMQISCDAMLYNIMGKNYQAIKKYELAEQNLKKAINLVPNRLYPHYLLAKLYYEMRLKEKTESEINIVLTKSPKVESTAVKEMKKELEQMSKCNE